MQSGTLEHNSLFHDDRLIGLSSIKINLFDLINNMKSSLVSSGKNLKSVILVNKSDIKILITALLDKTEITSFQSDDSITIQLLEGKLRLNTPKESVIVDKDHFITITEKVKYQLTPLEETVFLLTIASRPKTN